MRPPCASMAGSSGGLPPRAAAGGAGGRAWGGEQLGGVQLGGVHPLAMLSRKRPGSSVRASRCHGQWPWRNSGRGVQVHRGGQIGSDVHRGRYSNRRLREVAGAIQGVALAHASRAVQQTATCWLARRWPVEVIADGPNVDQVGPIGV